MAPKATLGQRPLAALMGFCFPSAMKSRCAMMNSRFITIPLRRYTFSGWPVSLTGTPGAAFVLAVFSRVGR